MSRKYGFTILILFVICALWPNAAMAQIGLGEGLGFSAGLSRTKMGAVQEPSAMLYMEPVPPRGITLAPGEHMFAVGDNVTIPSGTALNLSVTPKSLIFKARRHDGHDIYGTVTVVPLGAQDSREQVRERLDRGKQYDKHEGDWWQGELSPEFAPRFRGHKEQYNESPYLLVGYIPHGVIKGPCVIRIELSGEERIENRFGGVVNGKPDKSTKFFVVTCMADTISRPRGYRDLVSFLADLGGFKTPRRFAAKLQDARSLAIEDPETDQDQAASDQGNDQGDEGDEQGYYLDRKNAAKRIGAKPESERNREPQDRRMYDRRVPEQSREAAPRTDENRESASRKDEKPSANGQMFVSSGAPPVGSAELNTLIVRNVCVGSDQPVSFGGMTVIRASVTPLECPTRPEPPFGDKAPGQEEVGRFDTSQGFQALSTFIGGKSEALFSISRSREMWIEVWSALRAPNGQWSAWCIPNVYHVSADGRMEQVLPKGKTKSISGDTRGTVLRLTWDITTR